jgi:hypothetical protein
MTVGVDLERSGTWRDLSRIQAGVEWSAGPADVLRGRGLEEYARWLAWLIRVLRDSEAVLPTLGLHSEAAVRLCAGVPVEAAPVGSWVIARFPARAFVAVKLGEADAPAMLERATGTGLPVWRVRVDNGEAWRELARRVTSLASWLAKERGWAAAGMAAHFAACAERELG